MKSTRVFAIILALLSCVFAITPKFTLAKSGHFKVVEEDAVFYLDSELKTPLFYLTSGYYVAVEEELENCYKITYADNQNGYLKITGYTNKSSLLLSEPTAPFYPQISVKAKSTLILYEDANHKKQKGGIIGGQTLLVYGKGILENSYFALFGNEFGYVDIQNLEDFKIPPHLQESPSPTTPPSTENNDQVSDAFLQSAIPDSIKYLLIVFLVIPVALFTLFLFSVKKKDK